MNRIERLIWEETQLRTIERSRRKFPGAPGAKSLAIVVLVGALAVLASRMPIPHLDDVVVEALTPARLVYAPAAAPDATNDARRATTTGAHDPVDRDDP
jgi:hypothetical protein